MIYGSVCFFSKIITEKHCTSIITEVWMMLACINLQFWQSLGKQVSMAFNLHLEINNCFSLPKKLHFVFKAIHKRNIEHLTSII